MLFIRLLYIFPRRCQQEKYEYPPEEISFLIQPSNYSPVNRIGSDGRSGVDARDVEKKKPGE